MCENWDKICRMCLNEDSELKSLFLNYDNGFIPDFITESLSLQIFKGDDLPQNICNECTTKVTSIHENRKLFIENDHKLRKILTKDGHSEFVEVKFELDVDHFVNENDGHTKEEDSLKTNDSPSKSVENDTSVKEEESADEDCDNGDEIEEGSTSESDWEEDEIRPVKISKESSNKKKGVALSGEKKLIKRKVRPAHYPRLNDHKCYICEEKCETAKSLLDHLNQHVDKLPYTCKDCVMEKTVIKSLHTLNVHLKMHAQPIKCNYCDKRYSCTANRNAHIRSFHLNNDKTTFQCEICAKVCTSEYTFKFHMNKVHTKEFLCKICNKTFGDQRSLKRHATTHYFDKGGYECSICHNKCCDLSSYNMHMKRHNNERAYECQLCTATFVTSFDLRYHTKVHQKNTDLRPRNNLKDEYYTQKTVDGADQFQCNVCLKTFRKRPNIVGHVYSHLKYHKCSFCGKEFKDRSAVSDHENTHTGAKPHICKICGNRFPNKTRLYQHNKKHKKEMTPGALVGLDL